MCPIVRGLSSGLPIRTTFWRLAAGGEQWEHYVQTRIDTTHDYDQAKAENAIEIMPEFIADAIGLYTELTGEAWE